MTEIDLKDLAVEHHFGAGVYAKQTLIPAGHVLVQHKHVYDHLSILAAGTAVVSRDAGFAQITGPKAIVIPANELHRVEAITQCVWFCIHATNERDTGKIDDTLTAPTSRDELVDRLKRR